MRLHQPTVEAITEGMGRLGVVRHRNAVRIVAGRSPQHPRGFFYWGFTPDDAREFAADLCTLANELDPLGVN